MGSRTRYVTPGPNQQEPYWTGAKIAALVLAVLAAVAAIGAGVYFQTQPQTGPTSPQPPQTVTVYGSVGFTTNLASCVEGRLVIDRIDFDDSHVTYSATVNNHHDYKINLPNHKTYHVSAHYSDWCGTFLVGCDDLNLNQSDPSFYNFDTACSGAAG